MEPSISDDPAISNPSLDLVVQPGTLYRVSGAQRLKPSKTTWSPQRERAPPASVCSTRAPASIAPEQPRYRSYTMRSIIPTLVLVSSIIGTIGCQDRAPTEVSDALVESPAFQADQDWIRDEIWIENTLFIECLGEEVRFFGLVPIQWHQVTSPSGNYNYHFQYRPVTPNTPLFTAETASGAIYLYKNGGPINEAFHLGPGEVRTFISNETYVAENGDKLKGGFTFHLTVNANGDLKVLKLVPAEWVCIDK